MDEKEFEKLFRNHFSQLLNLAFNMVKDENVARDIVQQVYFNLWNKREDLKITKSYISYLYRAVYNSSLNHIKLKTRYVRVQNDSNFTSIAGCTDQEESLEGERIQLLQAAIEKLPTKCRLVFSLNRFENMTYKEVAEHLGISIKMVEKQITKALKTIRAELTRDKVTADLIILIFLFLMGGN
jgi:RNA polymerase sigma-70 factor, ECF subfamily